MEKFIFSFADLFDETAPETFTPATRFRELSEWSSLTALSVMAMVDEEYNVQLTGDEMRSDHTIEELYNLVQSKL